MKLKRILFAVLFLSVSVSHAQSKREIFNPATPVTWLGLDFSEARFIGDRERLGSESDIRHLMEALNQLVVNESSKYNIAKATGRERIESNISVTSAHNAELEVDEIYSDETRDRARLKESDIQAIVSSYDFKNLDGIGVMFIVESFSKVDNEGSVFVTFVNMNTKKILLTERMTGSPKGFGLRNYWGGAIYEIIETIRKKEFEAWRTKQ